jgi:3-oxoacyl-[acyl-carrier-protein] synthase II
MKNALRNARIQPSDLAYINTHATSTQVGDLAEINAIKRIFQDHNRNAADIYVSSFKGQLGHLLGAAGAVETILTLLSTWHKTAIATKNLHQIDAQLEMEQSPFLKILKDGDNRIFTQLPTNNRLVALKNSFGFGGTNASICLSNFVR